MALRIKLAKPTGKHTLSSLALRVALVAIAVFALVFLVVGGFYYYKYQGIVDARLKEPLFANTAKVFAAPREVRPRQKFSIHLIATELREVGYTPDGALHASQLGTYSEGAQVIPVRPVPEPYHSEDPATIRIGGGVVNTNSHPHGQRLSSDELEAIHKTGLSE